MNLQRRKLYGQLVIKSFVILTSSLDLCIILDSMEFSLTAENVVLLELQSSRTYKLGRN